MFHPPHSKQTARRQGFLFQDQQQSLKKIQEVKGFDCLKTKIQTLVSTLDRVFKQKKMTHFKYFNSELVDLTQQTFQQVDTLQQKEKKSGDEYSKKRFEKRNSSQRMINNHHSNYFFQKNQQMRYLDSDCLFGTSWRTQEQRNARRKVERCRQGNIEKSHQISKDQQILQYAALIQITRQLHRFHLKSCFLFIFRANMKINKPRKVNQRLIKINKAQPKTQTSSTPSQFKKQCYSLFLKPCHERQKQSFGSSKSIEYNKHLQEIEQKYKSKSQIEVRQLKLERNIEKMVLMFNKLYASHYRTFKIYSFTCKNNAIDELSQSIFSDRKASKQSTICEFKTAQCIENNLNCFDNIRYKTESTSCSSPLINRSKSKQVQNEVNKQDRPLTQQQPEQQSNLSIFENLRSLRIIIISQFLFILLIIVILL